MRCVVFSGQGSRTDGVGAVAQKKQTPSTEKPAVQLARFLKEPKEEGPFTTLQEERCDDAGETAFIGSWAGK